MIASGNTGYQCTGNGFFMVIEKPIVSIPFTTSGNQVGINYPLESEVGAIVFPSSTHFNATQLETYHSQGYTLEFYNDNDVLQYSISAGTLGTSPEVSNGWAYSPELGMIYLSHHSHVTVHEGVELTNWFPMLNNYGHTNTFNLKVKPSS